MNIMSMYHFWVGKSRLLNTSKYGWCNRTKFFNKVRLNRLVKNNLYIVWENRKFQVLT